LPRTHIVIASIEKIVPTLEDACTILRLLARSATGQDITTYTTFTTGPRREVDPDGPTAYDVVLLDNGRSDMLGGVFEDMLRCIRCGACLNHCPVYGTIGGHAYGSVYPGPMGAVLTPALQGLDHARDLPYASSLCGRCEEVCPMSIPLPAMLRAWRAEQFGQGKTIPAGRPGPELPAFALEPPPPPPYPSREGTPPAPLPSPRRSWSNTADAGGRRARPTEPAALCRTLDQGARPACPGGQNLPAALRQGAAERSSMSSPEQARAIVLARIRGALGIAELD